MTTVPTNADRALRARLALTVFTDLTFDGRYPEDLCPIDLQCAVIDLVADLLHFARQNDFDTNDILHHAGEHFASEINEEKQP